MIRGSRYPTEKHLRHALLDRVRRFVALTGRSRSEIGVGALNDKAAVGRIEEGSNFKIGTYQRLMTWLDDNWPRRRLTQRKSGRRQEATDNDSVSQV